MRYTKLGNTDLICSVIGFGGFAIGGTDWQGTSKESSREALIAAYEGGVNFFDTSNAYGWGNSEKLIGETLFNHRNNIIIATKGGIVTERHDYNQKNFAPQYLRRSLHEALRRLRTDYVDLYQLHSPRAEDLTDEVNKFMEKIAKEGKARYVGISISDEASGMRALQIPLYSSLQVFFNMLQQGLKREFFPAAQKAGVGLICRTPLFSGFLSGRYSSNTVFSSDDHRSRWPANFIAKILQKVERLKKMFPGRDLTKVALAFTIACGEISIVIPGAKNILQVKANISALNVNLTEEEMALIYNFYEEF